MLTEADSKECVPLIHLPVLFLQLSLRESVYFFHLGKNGSAVPRHYLLYSLYIPAASLHVSITHPI